MPRTRTFLIDNNFGQIFTGVNSIASATAANRIAGQSPKTKMLAATTKASVQVANNLGGTATGMKLDGSSGLVSSVVLTVKKAPSGRGIIVRVRIGATYESSTVAATLTLGSGSTSSTSSVSISYGASDSFYFDVTQVGNFAPGNGLSINLNYFSA